MEDSLPNAVEPPVPSLPREGSGKSGAKMLFSHGLSIGWPKAEGGASMRSEIKAVRCLGCKDSLQPIALLSSLYTV